ncbi:putative GTP-binding protein SAR1B [Paratrimastix pyriformis]|uniref:GTP-binding protein SAR1B n=1 Tax=Paratrimastix pyriformis TaxID=342808 RepID=A0ABQ8ULI3_9EUKA|nr:putative GTP-binding protein SAR1B [Paratrimastix pyriformis]
MFIWNFIKSVLEWTGLLNKRGKLVFLGLDNAGKTTLLHMLKYDGVIPQEPTQMPSSLLFALPSLFLHSSLPISSPFTVYEELKIGNLRIGAHDLGGHEEARLVWKEYYHGVNAVVFIVDAVDRMRFPEAKRELDRLLNDESIANVPFLVLGNKIDMPYAASEDELRSALGLRLATTGKGQGISRGVRPLELFMCSVIKRRGYGDGLRWLTQFF